MIIITACWWFAVDFIGVNAYIVSMFAPLGFLGSVYSSILKGLVDIRNLSELLSEAPDVTDAPNAKPLRLTATASADSSALASLSCPKCGSKMSATWRFCPHCQTSAMQRAGAGASPQDIGVAVEFRSNYHP